MKSEKWYKEGLRFKCTECGKCCTGAPGYVWISEDEIQTMADFLDISSNDFKKRYVRNISNRLSLTESKKNYDCVFLKEGKCQVYGARPNQCKTFPFWPQNLSSPAAWKKASEECEGIHDQAPLILEEQIAEALKPPSLKKEKKDEVENAGLTSSHSH